MKWLETMLRSLLGRSPRDEALRDLIRSDLAQRERQRAMDHVSRELDAIEARLFVTRQYLSQIEQERLPPWR